MDIAARTSGGRLVEVWVMSSNRLVARNSIEELLLYGMSDKDFDAESRSRGGRRGDEKTELVGRPSALAPLR
jgi:hypothetical protein